MKLARAALLTVFGGNPLSSFRTFLPRNVALPCQRQLEPFGPSGVGVGLDERFVPVRAGLWGGSPCCALGPCFNSHHPAGTERAGFLLDEMKLQKRAPGAHPVGWGCLVAGPAPSRALVPARPSLCCAAAQRLTSRPEPAAFEVFEWLPLALIGFVAGPNDLVVIWKGMFRDFHIMRKCYLLKSWVQTGWWSVLEWKWAPCCLLESFCPCQKNKKLRKLVLILQVRSGVEISRRVLGRGLNCTDKRWRGLHSATLRLSKLRGEPLVLVSGPFVHGFEVKRQERGRKNQA